MKNRLTVAFVSIVVLCCLGSVGCQDKTSTGSSSSATTLPSVDKSKQFVASLKAMPPDQRRAYAKEHQDLVDGVNRSGDASVRNEFMQLMAAAPAPK